MTSFAIYLHSVTCRVHSSEEDRRTKAVENLVLTFLDVLNPLLRTSIISTDRSNCFTNNRIY